MPAQEEYRRAYMSRSAARAIRRLLSEPRHPVPMDAAEEEALRRLVFAWECGDYDPDYLPPRVRGEVSADQMILDYALRGLAVCEASRNYAGPRRRRTDDMDEAA